MACSLSPVPHAGFHRRRGGSTAGPSHYRTYPITPHARDYSDSAARLPLVCYWAAKRRPVVRWAMRRREFVAGLCAGMVCWVEARAEQVRTYRVGLLASRPVGDGEER